MKRTILPCILTAIATVMLMAGTGRVSQPVHAQSDSRAQDFYTLARQRAIAVYENAYALKAMQREWNSNGYGSTLPVGTGSNSGITRTQLGPVIFDSADAIVGVLEANGSAHAGNLIKMY